MTMSDSIVNSTAIPSFSRFKLDQIEPELTALLKRNKEQLQQILAQADPYSWDNLLRPLEVMNDELHMFWSPVKHLNAVANSELLRTVYKNCLPLVTDYGIELMQNEELYKAIDSVAKSPEFNQLNLAQKKVIEHYLRDFRLSGVHLQPREKALFAALDKELSQLSTQFEENVLDATQGWSKLISDEAELSGIPPHAVAAARQAAEEKQLKGWLFTLDAPSYIAVSTYADSRPLRYEMYFAYSTRASDQGPNAGKWDNSEVMEKILKTRYEMAKLLEFSNFVEYSLATKMAKQADEVMTFLNDLAEAALPQARQEFKELAEFAQKNSGIETLEAWDVAYYSEKLCQHDYAVSSEDYRPYLAETNVVNGLFSIVEKLYGLHITELPNPDAWKKEVRLFAVHDETAKLRGHFYMDLYARSDKRGGAWMDDCRIRRQVTNAEVQTPIAFITCNFNAPIGDDPALFTHDEVTTLFHEFGHALQHLLTTVDYAEVSGINGIPWDAVEIASQFMESWCWEQPAIALFAQHYQTKQPLPEELFTKLIKARNFHSAIQMIRQLQFSLFDFRLHLEYDPSKKNQIRDVLDEVRKQLFIFPTPAFNRFQHSFTHIFAGGYAAGYYGYKWAEVLACDAFSKFSEQGIFDRKTGQEFLHTLLESGGTVEPMELFIQFRGRPPKIDALLESNGITVKSS